MTYHWLLERLNGIEGVKSLEQCLPNKHQILCFLVFLLWVKYISSCLSFCWTGRLILPADMSLTQDFFQPYLEDPHNTSVLFLLSQSSFQSSFFLLLIYCWVLAVVCLSLVVVCRLSIVVASLAVKLGSRHTCFSSCSMWAQ